MDTELVARLRAVIPRLARVLNDTSTGEDLTPTQYSVLALTRVRGPLGLTELTELEGLNPTMVSRVVKVLDDTIIQPFTIGRSVHLHPALLLGSVVVGSHALGVLGMIIAVPVATVLQETARLLLEHRRVLARRDLRHHPERLVI